MLSMWPPIGDGAFRRACGPSAQAALGVPFRGRSRLPVSPGPASAFRRMPAFFLLDAWLLCPLSAYHKFTSSDSICRRRHLTGAHRSSALVGPLPEPWPTAAGPHNPPFFAGWCRFLGTYDHASRQEILKTLGVTHILNVGAHRRRLRAPACCSYRCGLHLRRHGV